MKIVQESCVQGAFFSQEQKRSLHASKGISVKKKIKVEMFHFPFFIQYYLQFTNKQMMFIPTKYTFLVVLIIMVIVHCQYHPYNRSFYDNPKVVPQDTHCMQLNTDKTACLKCYPGYTLSKPPSPICKGSNFLLPNCMIYDNYNNCLFCLDGYYLNYSITTPSTCVALNNGCSTYDNASYTCQKCLPGWTKLIVINYYYPSANDTVCNFTIDPNCLAYVNNTYCALCKTGYVLLNSQCYQLPLNCISLSPDTMICQKCVTNYQLGTNGTCISIPKIANCLTQVDFTCQACTSGYVLTNNSCNYYIANCLKVNASNMCDSCATSYTVMSDGTCKQVDPNCKIFDTLSGICISCSNGYYLNSSKECSQISPLCKTYNAITGQCLSCYTGYILDIIKGVCFTNPSNSSLFNNCTQYDSVNKACTACVQGYFINLTVCSKYRDPNCISPSSDFKYCLQCLDSSYIYNVISKNCEKINQLCTMRAVTFNVCLSCMFGRVWDLKSNCALINPLCILFNKITNKCELCYGGYVLDSNGSCKVVPNALAPPQKYTENCASFNSKKQCISCFSGWYVLRDSIGGYYCQKVSDVCLNYNLSNGLCTSCYNGYLLTAQGDCQIPH